MLCRWVAIPLIIFSGLPNLLELFSGTTGLVKARVKELFSADACYHVCKVAMDLGSELISSPGLKFGHDVGITHYCPEY